MKNKSAKGPSPPIPPGEHSTKVGYKRPPVSGQFKKGTSGNPSGRPKAGPLLSATNAATFNDIFDFESWRIVDVKENGNIEKLPLMQIAVRNLALLAGKGNYKAIVRLFDYARDIEQQRRKRLEEDFKTAYEHKVTWEAKFAECDKKGLPHPYVVPHPAEIAYNARTLEVWFNGPIDEGDQLYWDQLLRIKTDAIAELAVLKKKRIGRSAEQREEHATEIEAALAHIDMTDALIPDEETRRQPTFVLQEWRKQQEHIRQLKQKLRAEQRARKSSGK